MSTRSALLGWGWFWPVGSLLPCSFYRHLRRAMISTPKSLFHGGIDLEAEVLAKGALNESSSNRRSTRVNRALV